MMGEVWRDIKGYEGAYQVSNLGRVRSLPRLRHVIGVHRHNGSLHNESWLLQGKILHPVYLGSTTEYVRLYDGSGKRTQIAVKVLVAATFLSPGQIYEPKDIQLKDKDAGCSVDNLIISKSL